MCGITGYNLFSDRSPDLTDNLHSAIVSLCKRGPDYQNSVKANYVGLGHTRLSIIDTSSRSHQPMKDPSGRYTLVFNGEIYNYRELREELDAQLLTTSDTEVLLHLLIKEGENCLKRLNGFFAFAFYDAHKEILLLGRDRMGIKPLHYYEGEDYFVFGSEMKALLSYPVPRIVDQQSLYWYLRLTYLPPSMSMIKGVKKLAPGHYLKISNKKIQLSSFYQPDNVSEYHHDFQNAQKNLIELLEKSVERRMVSDVPLGAFLSGGTDSSVVVSLASKFNTQLNTFSIGYKDHAFFDETAYAELVASKFKTNHTTFKLTNADLLESLESVIDYIDEPFADSSAIPTYILSQKVGQSMKVALSGDGADELFGGYYKHLAFEKVKKMNRFSFAFKLSNAALTTLPKSRSSTFGNLVRRMTKFSELLDLDKTNQYWRLASFMPECTQLMQNPPLDEQINQEIEKVSIQDLNDFLDMDLQMVLPGDMLTKVDLMSMANSLEVRVPFLDPNVVDFARSLPSKFKVHGTDRKRVLQDAFAHILPKELHNRPKKGFEVPMLSWLRNELNNTLTENVFDRHFIEEQGLFKWEAIAHLRKKLNSNNPGDVHSSLWTLYVFQRWYRKTIE